VTCVRLNSHYMQERLQEVPPQNRESVRSLTSTKFIEPYSIWHTTWRLNPFPRLPPCPWNPFTLCTARYSLMCTSFGHQMKSQLATVRGQTGPYSAVQGFWLVEEFIGAGERTYRVWWSGKEWVFIRLELECDKVNCT
jgi:hypothetical protein